MQISRCVFEGPVFQLPCLWNTPFSFNPWRRISNKWLRRWTGCTYFSQLQHLTSYFLLKFGFFSLIFFFSSLFQVVVSAIRSGALEKLRRKPILLMSDSFSWVYSPITRELYLTPKGLEQKENMNDEDYEGEEFLSVKSCFSCCSSAASRDVFVSVQTSFSRSSSLNGVDLKEFQRRSIIEEFCHCEGWPFGLCRKAVLLPPLPKSPSESWSWRKGTKTAKLTYCWIFLFFYSLFP